MKLINANKNGLTIHFDRQEFDALFLISRSVRQEFENIDLGILELERDEVRNFDDKIANILDLFISENKHLEDGESEHK